MVRANAFVCGSTTRPDFPIIDPLAGQGNWKPPTASSPRSVPTVRLFIRVDVPSAATYGTIPRRIQPLDRDNVYVRRSGRSTLLCQQLRYRANFPPPPTRSNPATPRSTAFSKSGGRTPTAPFFGRRYDRSGEGDLPFGPTTSRPHGLTASPVFGRPAAPYVTITLTRTGRRRPGRERQLHDRQRHPIGQRQLYDHRIRHAEIRVGQQHQRSTSDQGTTAGKTTVRQLFRPHCPPSSGPTKRQRSKTYGPPPMLHIYNTRPRNRHRG